MVQVMEFTQYQFLKQHALEVLKEDGKTIPPVQEINPIVLAYIGDVVFSMYVRLRLLPTSKQVRVIHDLGSKMVSAICQCQAMESLQEELSDAEQVVFRRGRNAKSTVPKSASVHEYRMATAFEALLGYLFLEDEEARLEEILDKSFAVITEKLLSHK
ncbi:MAG: ribonuclease III domain-containing protein [Phascolarctobacterium sp.]|nr:ribonuclease III domain-containing protein [Phascolarctobacterium sp.]